MWSVHVRNRHKPVENSLKLNLVECIEWNCLDRKLPKSRRRRKLQFNGLIDILVFVGNK